MSDVQLHVGGVSYGGWERIEVNRTLEAVAGTFSLQVTEYWPGAQSKAAVAPGAPCTLTIDDEPVITGFVDDVGPTYDKETHEVQIRGRDRTGDLVDCSVMRQSGAFGVYINQTLLQIVADICQPFGITVKSTIDLSLPFAAFALRLGETAYQAIERGCRHRAALAVSDGQGGLILTRPGSAGINSKLALGQNILSAEGTNSHRERFSDYYVFSQGAGGDWIDPEVSAGALDGKAKDPGIKRYRPLIIISELPETDATVLGVRAQWEASVRAARGRCATPVVAGWRDAAHALWQPNRMVEVEDAFLSLSEDMLVSGVKLTSDDDGEQAAITVTGRAAFEPSPLPPNPDYDL